VREEAATAILEAQLAAAAEQEAATQALRSRLEKAAAELSAVQADAQRCLEAARIEHAAELCAVQAKHMSVLGGARAELAAEFTRRLGVELHALRAELEEQLNTARVHAEEQLSTARAHAEEELNTARAHAEEKLVVAQDEVTIAVRRALTAETAMAEMAARAAAQAVALEKVKAASALSTQLAVNTASCEATSAPVLEAESDGDETASQDSEIGATVTVASVFALEPSRRSLSRCELAVNSGVSGTRAHAARCGGRAAPRGWGFAWA
jgi:hypothetical protein